MELARLSEPHLLLKTNYFHVEYVSKSQTEGFK